MKKFIISLLSCMLLISAPSFASELDQMQQEFDRAVGFSANDSMTAGVGISMMGWGLAFIIGISILSIVFHQSASTTQATTKQGGTGSGGGIGSSI